jgi:ATP-dependent RNA helicase RhlB
LEFTKRALHQSIQKGIEKAGFTKCLPVQVQTFEQVLDKGRDVCVQSQTGTGKTAAFLISILQLLLTHDSFKGKKALVVAPTRELAVQITEEAQLLGQFTKVRTGCFFGGVDFTKQEDLLRKGVDIIVGTPGRLLDFSQQGKLDLKKIGILIIDEADRLFDMGFLPDIRRLIKKMPPYQERRTMLFSATLDSRVKELAWEHMNDPAEIKIAPGQVTVESVTQELYHVEQKEKMKLLLGILKKERPKNVLIFTNTKHMAYEVAQRLSRNGFDCRYIMGDLPQKKRLQVIDGIKSGEIKYLVATEVAARGLHIDDLDLVINYDLPAECESYVHRIGRTARVGKPGKAISFACDKYVYGLEGIESFTKMKIPVVWADDALFEKDKSEGMTFRQPRGGRIMESTGRPSSKTRRSPAAQGTPPAGRKPRRASRGDRHAHTGTGQDTSITREHTGTTKGAPAPRHRKVSRPEPRKTVSRLGRNSTPEERLAYYKKKYGEDFTPRTPETPPPAGHQKPKRKKSLLKKIKDFLTK